MWEVLKRLRVLITPRDKWRLVGVVVLMAAGALLDLLFCLLAGIGAFLYGMSAGNGRLGLWDLTGVLTGFLLYMHILSPLLLPRFTAVLDFCGRFADRRKKERRKSDFSAKNTSKT